jgi:hypothetical protein
VPAELADVVQRALEISATDRLASPAAMIEALHAAAQEVAGARAVAALVEAMAPREQQRLQADHARREVLTAQAKAISERPADSAPPPAEPPPPAPRPERPRREVLVVAGEHERLEAPRSLTPLWIALAVGAVAAIGYVATRSRLSEPAHYIMQVVRPPPLPSPAASASVAASALPSAPPRVRRRVRSAPSFAPVESAAPEEIPTPSDSSAAALEP